MQQKDGMLQIVHGLKPTLIATQNCSPIFVKKVWTRFFCHKPASIDPYKNNKTQGSSTLFSTCKQDNYVHG